MKKELSNDNSFNYYFFTEYSIEEAFDRSISIELLIVLVSPFLITSPTYPGIVVITSPSLFFIVIVNSSNV